MGGMGILQVGLDGQDGWREYYSAAASGHNPVPAVEAGDRQGVRSKPAYLTGSLDTI
jgi:hypothetical protein